MKLSNNQIKEINKLISDFYIENDKYHSDWNLIIPVIEKINNLKVKCYRSFDFDVNSCSWISWKINIPGDQNQTQDYSDDKDLNWLENVFVAVGKFIQFYNTLNTRENKLKRIVNGKKRIN